MRNYQKLKAYSVFEINDIMDTLREKYDIVRLVDVEECRIMEIEEDGTIDFGNNCFSIWNRKNRCANCSSMRACKTHSSLEKLEHLGKDREKIRSIPVYLEMKNEELQLCVIECVQYVGTEKSSYKEVEPEEYINTHDVLTCLYTQEKAFREIRKKLIEHPDEPYLLVIGNIRNFSLVNQLFGIEGGNRLLTGIADLLRREFSEEEVYGRYRDDRFLLLIRKDKFREEAIERQLQKIRSMVESPIFSVEMKLGVYEVPNLNMPVTTMIEHADAAVESIRDDREKAVAYFQPSMIEQRRKKHRVVASFEEALKNGEFDIYLQPQVEKSGKIVGAEALVRWMKPDGTILLPGEFLDELHESELLSFLDQYVWERAAQVLADWKGTALEPLYISVNVDPLDFYYMDVPKVLSKLCGKYDILPEKLHVEITEKALVQDLKQECNMVDQLHDAGFLVEIDDFGKGFSSLSLLKDIRADVLKIDMSFIQGDQNLSRSEVILGKVIEMANNLQMGVITEGVETRVQEEKLISLGCRRFQGFFYSRPIPVADFTFVAQSA